MDIARMDNFVASLGVEAYRVGGSVRDEILGREPKDADYVVLGVPLDDLGKLLVARGGPFCARITRLKLRDGRQAGWRVAGRGIGFAEIMLPRRDISTGPGHRDFKIVVDPNMAIGQDAVRRDFTFNALYRVIRLGSGTIDQDADRGGLWAPTILDPLGGESDLRHKRIQVTYRDSFRDDPLRILRALRFVSTLDYDLAPETYFLMREYADAVVGMTSNGGVSGTVFEEFDKLLGGQNPAEALRIARDTGVLKVALPELAPMLDFNQDSRYHDMTADEHTFSTLETAAHVDAPQTVRWALLFHDSGKPDSAWGGKDGKTHYYGAWVTENDPETWENREVWYKDHQETGRDRWLAFCERVNVPNALRKDVATLIERHMLPADKVKPQKIRRLRVELGDRMLRDLIEMRMCDLSGKGNPNMAWLHNLGLMEDVRESADAASVPRSVKDLRITGGDVMALDVEGRDIGRILRAVLDEVVLDPSDTKLTFEWQLQAAGRHA